MNRRGALRLAISAAIATGALRAQATSPVVIGWLVTGSREASARGLRLFDENMAALGWKAGTQYVVEERFADGRVDRLPALAQEIAASKPALILVSPSSSARAAAEAAPTTPVVLFNGDLLATGLVKNLARPGGMITGLSNVSAEANLKVLELLVEAMPRLQRVGFLADSTTPTHGTRVAETRLAAERARVRAVIVDMAKPEDIEPAVGRLAKGKAEALVLMSSSWFAAHLPTVVALARAQRWPVAGSLYSTARQGGLLSYGANSLALARRAAWYVDRILKGDKPGDLPIEQPTTYRFVLNMKTAKALGLAIPQAVLLRATEVIE